MNEPSIDYADFAEYDRRQRGIERHLLTSFLGGLAVGLVGMLAVGRGPGWLGLVYDPYVYLALILAVGATASGFGWALLTTFLAIVATLVAGMGAGALRGGTGFETIGGSAAGLNWTLALLVALGLLAHVTRRQDGWGDAAAGAIGAILVADAFDRATPGFIDSEQAFWPWPALAVGVLTVALVLWLRRSLWGRVRALAFSTVLGGLFTLAFASFVTGWIPLAL